MSESQSHVRKKTEIQIEFGKRVRSKRQALGYTQEELAGKSSLDSTYIGSIERGERNVSLGNVIAIASALNVTPNELIPRSHRSHHKEKEKVKVAFGKNLHSKRELRGFSQEELARRADRTVDFIRSCELGDGAISFEDIIALAKALDIALKELL